MVRKANGARVYTGRGWDAKKGIECAKFNNSLCAHAWLWHGSLSCNADLQKQITQLTPLHVTIDNVHPFCSVESFLLLSVPVAALIGNVKTNLIINWLEKNPESVTNFTMLFLEFCQPWIHAKNDNRGGDYSVHIQYSWQTQRNVWREILIWVHCKFAVVVNKKNAGNVHNYPNNIHC